MKQVNSTNLLNSSKIEISIIKLRSVNKGMFIGSVNNNDDVRENNAEPQSVHIYECNTKYHFVYMNMDQRNHGYNYIPVGAASCNKDCNPTTVAREILKNASELF